MPLKRYKFKAKIEPGEGGGAYVFFPYGAEEEFAGRSKVPVQATLSAVAYTGSLMACGGTHLLLAVPKTIRQQIGKGPGDTIDIEVWRDEAQRTLEVPAVFAQRMKEEGLLGFFEGLSPTHRKEYCRWISEAKKEETRARRLEKAVDMLRKKVRTPG